MIYLFDDMDNIPGDLISETFALMPPERRERASRYRHGSDRAMCVTAYWLLMYGLEEEYGITRPPVFTYGEKGKPYLTEHPDVFFNLSHCKKGVVCVISSREAGVDIQDTRPYNAKAARRVCCGDELARLAQSNAPDKLFCKIWSIKESYVKKQGGGIAQPLHELDAFSLLEEAEGKAVSRWGGGYHMCCFGETAFRPVMM